MKISFPHHHLTVTVTMACCLAFFSSCQENLDPTLKQPDAPVYSQDVFEQILSLGFNRKDIVDRGSYYVVGGDIKFNKSLASDKNAKVAHSFHSVEVNLTKINNITVRVDNSFSNSTWRQDIIDATTDAINSWNTIPNSKIQLSYTSGSSADITIKYNSGFGAGEYGLATWPVGCNPGPMLELNFQSELMNRAQRHFLITHELGHCIAFRHTDEGSSYGTHILNTPYTETASIMNSGPAQGATVDYSSVPQWSSFSAGDKTAAKQLYPAGGAAIEAIYDSQDGSGLPVRITWTTSNFCNSQVTVAIYDGDTLIKSTQGTTQNDGIHNFSTSQLQSGYTYEFRVYADGADPSTLLYSNVSLNF